MNLKAFLLGLGPLGVASSGVEDAVGAAAEMVGGGLAAGEVCVATPEPPQPETAHARRHTADNLRTLRQV